MTKGSKSRLLHILASLARGDEGPCRQLGAVRITASVVAALFKDNRDGTIFVTSLPQMAQSFRADAVDLNIGIAMEVVSAAGIVTPDLGGTATTQAVTSVVCEAVRGANLPEGTRA